MLSRVSFEYLYWTLDVESPQDCGDSEPFKSLEVRKWSSQNYAFATSEAVIWIREVVCCTFKKSPIVKAVLANLWLYLFFSLHVELSPFIHSLCARGKCNFWDYDSSLLPVIISSFCYADNWRAASICERTAFAENRHIYGDDRSRLYAFETRSKAVIWCVQVFHQVYP